MKNLTEKLNESTSDKYCISWIDKNGHNLRYTCSNYRSFIDSLENNYEYYEVMDNSCSNFSEPDGLIEWAGKNGYWANVYEYSSHPDNAPKWATIMKGSKLDKISKCRKK